MKLRKIMYFLMLAVFIFSTFMLVKQFADKFSAGDAYSNALTIASGADKKIQTAQPETPPETTVPEPVKTVWIPAPVEEEDPHMEDMANIDLAALQEVNPDVLGWIRIPDTRINYPLLQGTDNDYYLKHTWEHQNNSVGSIFLEHRNSPDFTDYNTIVYGHNMKDGSMFAGLRKYAEKNYRENHPYVYLTTEEGVYRYEIFSTYLADVEGTAYGLSFQQEKTRANFLIQALEQSSIETGIVPELTDRILTLSTCSGAGYTTRWVVHARLKMVEVEHQSAA